MSRVGQEGPISPFTEEGAGTKLGRPAGVRLLLCAGCCALQGKWTTPQVALLPLTTMSGLRGKATRTSLRHAACGFLRGPIHPHHRVHAMAQNKGWLPDSLSAHCTERRRQISPPCGTYAGPQPIAAEFSDSISAGTHPTQIHSALSSQIQHSSWASTPPEAQELTSKAGLERASGAGWCSEGR